jgi:hypothetical protein
MDTINRNLPSVSGIEAGLPVTPDREEPARPCCELVAT